jgi:hypothetical protein
MQLAAVTRLAMRKGVLTDHVQGVSIGQLCAPQRLELVGRGMQFQFGGQRCFYLWYCITLMFTLSRREGRLPPYPVNGMGVRRPRFYEVY